MKKYFLQRPHSSFVVDYEKDLNPEQLTAVMHGTGPALVLAGAGTGKTRVVTYRVARLIESGVSAENILLLTFTNKAAREMMRRAEQLIGRNIRGLNGGTFHHIALTLLRRHYILAGLRQGFTILDREDGRELFDACSAELYKRDTVLPKGSVLTEIYGLSKNTGMGLSEAVHLRFPHFLETIDEIEKIAGLYEEKKRLLNLVDFDDLLVMWRTIFEQHENIREYYSAKFSHVLVDEYQDTNRLQAEIIDLTVSGRRDLMVVGDDAQSIYSFRGADFENILKFPDRYPEAAVYKLTTNYRSTPEVLYLANRSIINNRRQFAKELHAVVPSGETPYVVPLRDVFEEAAFVSSVIMDLNADGRPFDDIAVLYRSHYQSMQLQMELQRRGVPFEIRSGLKFFEQAHIKDVLSQLKVTINPFDEIAWKRTLKLIRGIGNTTASRIWDRLRSSGSPLEALAEAAVLAPKKSVEGFNRLVDSVKTLRDKEYQSSPSAAVDHLLRNGYEEYLYATYPNAEMRIEDIEQMIRFAARYESLELFLTDLALLGADAEDRDDDTEGKVVLSTVHQAKGLEWGAVFILGMNDGRFPSMKSLRSGDEEEERRLFYVGTTRARELLYLCYCLTSDDRHTVGFIRPSRFLKELPADSFEEISVEGV